MNGRHDTPLVALSILIAICASYTALSLAGRVAVARGRARLVWLLGGSVAMGSGIWSMHFVAMLAFHLPVTVSYDVPLVALSHLAAVAASAFALFVASRPKVSLLRLFAAGQCLGLAIVAMHYIGMAAVRVPAHLGYDPTLVAMSVLIAVGASTVALLLFMWLRNDNTRRGRSLRAAAAVVMGLAIAGMHYTAMAAAQFTHMPDHTVARAGQLGSAGLAIPVAIGAFVILALTLLGSITDHWVRAKLAAGDALRQSEERYRSVVSEIDEVIFRTDAAGRLTFLNAAWTTITGFAPAASLGSILIDAVHPDDYPKILSQWQSLAEGNTEFIRHEVRYLTSGDGARWVEIHARATRNANGELVGTTGVIRDFTERHRAEEALRSARQVAEAANHAKSEFLSRMSHELRTPLNAILGFGQLMELDAATADQQESATQILKGGRHLLSLINEVLDITGIEAGLLPLSVEPVLVREVVAEVRSLIEPLAAARRIELTSDEQTMGDLFVQADRQRLKQILLNLAANAVKYNREGGSARVTAERLENERVRIVVVDTGRGIPPEKVSRLFTPFDRLGVEQTVEGTGLGLALSKRLAEAMGGVIGVETTVEVGSRFWIELPRAEGQLSRLGSGDGDPGNVGTPDTLRRRAKVLYVEDNLSNLTLMQHVLARQEHIELIPAMSGGLALDLARLHRPDLVLLDLHLPDIPGEEVLSQLRKEASCRDIPIVVLSADATPGQVDRLVAAGAHAYLTKPLDLKLFLAVLAEVLAMKKEAA